MRSSSALVATVVPILTLAMEPTGSGPRLGTLDEIGDAGDGGVLVGLRVFRQELVGKKAAVRRARDDVGERSAAVDEELPFAAHAQPMRLSPAA